MIPFTCNRKCWISFRCYICIAVLLDFCVTSTIHISTTSNCLPPKQYWLLLSCDWLTMFYISSDFCLSCRMAKSFHFWTNGCGQRTAIAADGEGIQNHWVTALHLVCSLHIPYSFQFHLFFWKSNYEFSLTLPFYFILNDLYWQPVLQTKCIKLCLHGYCCVPL